jgi:GT2 family glycosyltransferase
MADTKISVVIPTKNRPQELGRTVETLARQTVLPDQLILVDQSSVKATLEGLPFSVTHIYDPEITGAAQARNRALDLIPCGIVLFLDDDVELEPDFIAQILDTYAHNPAADGVSGIITNYSPPPLWKRAYDRVFRLGPFFDERQPVYWKANRLIAHPPIPVHKFTGCAMSFRRSRIGELRFDEKLTRGSLAEDSDFCYGLGRSAMLFIAPRARLRHLRTPTARQETFHWAELEMRTGHYYFGRHGYKYKPDWLFFAWFNIGLFSLTIASSIRRRSLHPLRKSWAGAKVGRQLAVRR